MIPALNDSKPIAMCIYIVVILSTLGIPVEFVVHDINITYGLTSTLIIAGTSITQCLIFVPKVRESIWFCVTASNVPNVRLGQSLRRHLIRVFAIANPAKDIKRVMV